MTLYHFTAEPFRAKIQRSGIRRGRVAWSLNPLTNDVRMMGGLTWLTSDPEFDTQTWAELGENTRVIRKNDWRIAVEIPRLAEFKLHRWEDFARHHSLESHGAYYSKIRGNQHWWIFRGPIPTSWIAGWVKNPSLRNLELFRN